MTSDSWLISNAKTFYGIIDVRSPEEFQAGSMPGARNLTLALNEGEAETVRSVSRSNLLKGSLLATEFLTRKAYQQIATLRQEFPEGSQILIYGDSVDDERVSMWVDALAKFGVKVSILES